MKSILLLCGGCIVGVFGTLLWIGDPPLEPSQTVILETETQPLKVHVTTTPLACPKPRTVTEWSSKKTDRAWVQIERSASRMDTALADLTYEAISCDNAFRGWTSAMSHWQAACSGDKEACL